MVWGDYDVKDKRIRIAFCGNNFGGPRTDGVNNMNTYYDELKRKALKSRAVMFNQGH